jgi:hypothetical protein
VKIESDGLESGFGVKLVFVFSQSVCFNYSVSSSMLLFVTGDGEENSYCTVFGHCFC